MKYFCFTVDDNIRFLKEITENRYQSIFEHPYLAMYRRFHKECGLKVQLNLFYRMEDFDLSQVSDCHYEEWKENTDWLKLSFHSDCEVPRAYAHAGYDAVYQDCEKVHKEITRFASASALANTTTVHCCHLTEAGRKAMKDHGVYGLLGLFGIEDKPCTSYEVDEHNARRIRSGESVKLGGISYASIDVVLNLFSKEEIIEQLQSLIQRKNIQVMIHEQYFYRDYANYQPDFEEKLCATFSYLCSHGYESSFYEDLVES